MKLDLNKLQNVRTRNGKTLAACPACRENGGDSAGEHLAIFPSGGFACAAHQKDREHSTRILSIAGSSAANDDIVLAASPLVELTKPLDWHHDSTRLARDQAAQKRIAEWRGWPVSFVESIAKQGLMGLWGGRPCFPVRLGAGRGPVVGRHVFSWPEERVGSHNKGDAWFSPAGVAPLTPLLLGWSPSPHEIAVFESQWDALSIQAALGAACPPLLVTRGTSPTVAFNDALQGVESVTFWMQRDAPKQDGTIPSEQWLTRCRKLLPTTIKVATRVDPPGTFKDWNDALRAMSPDELKAAALQAIKNGQPLDLSVVSTPTAGGLPQPLPDVLPPVPAFDADILLPPVLRDYVLDCSMRLQVDPSFVAVPLLCSIGSLMGNRIALRPKQRDDWGEYPNIWGAIIGRPSTLKTPGLNEGMRPLHRLQEAANKLHKEALLSFRKDAAANDIKRTAAKAQALKSAKKGDDFDIDSLIEDEESAPPCCRRYMTSDAGPEALHQILTQPENAHGIMIFQDELTGVLARMADQERGAALRAFMLAGWNGNQSFVVDRIGRGENLRVDKCCLSVVGGIQPGKIAPLVDGANRESLHDDGWIQRLSLLVWPDTSKEYHSNDSAPDHDAFARVMRLFEQVEATQGPDFPGSGFDEGRQQHFLRLAPEASAHFLSWLETETRTLRQGDHSAAVESHFIKMRKTVPALALIFHVVSEWSAKEVSLACLHRALRWCDYLKAHALRVYGSGQSACASTAMRILQKLRAKELPATFTAREVKRRAWSGLTDAKAVDAALELLADHNWIIATERDSLGRRTIDFTAHPKIFENAPLTH